MESRRFAVTEAWRVRYRADFPEVGRRQGTTETQAWANSRDAGQLLGATARLHPQMRACIEALGVGDANPRWVPDSSVIRASAGEPQPLWGDLMGGPDLRLRLALMGWALGQDLSSLDNALPVWEAALGVEQVRKRALRKSGPRDDQYDLPRALSAVQKKAAAAEGVDPNPQRVLSEELYGPSMPSRLELKYGNLKKVPLDDKDYARLGWSVRPPASAHTGIADGLLRQGWHLVAPTLVLGWMVALPLLHEPKGRAKHLGQRHLGLRTGFRAADRARYFLKLSREYPDLATLTLQRNILWALAELKVVPPTITDAGVPIQTLLVGQHEDDECCVLISGDCLRLWYREHGEWQTVPQVLESLHATRERFSMTQLVDYSIRLDGVRVGRSRDPFVVRDLTLHTFPTRAEAFPAKAWDLRTGLDARFVVPTQFLDADGNTLLL